MSKLACIIIGILSALTVSAIAGNEEDGLAKLFSSFRFARSAIPAERDSKKFRKDDNIKKRSLSKAFLYNPQMYIQFRYMFFSHL